MKLPFAALPLLLSAVVLPASADDFYVLAAAGQSRFKVARDEIDSTLRRAGALGLSSSTKENGDAYKIQFGYRINPNLAVEAGYVDLGKAKYSATFLGGRADASTKAAGANVALLGSVAVGESTSVFAKIGAINAKADTSLRATGVAASISSTHLRTNVGLGATYDFNQRTSARLEFEKFYKLGDQRGGTHRVDLWSLGLAINF